MTPLGLLSAWMRLVAARLPADMCEDALIAEGTAAKVEAFADLLAAPCGFLGFGAWAGFGLRCLDMMFGLSRKDWPFLVMSQTSLMVPQRRRVLCCRQLVSSTGR